MELLYFLGKSEGWVLSQAKARSCVNYLSKLADLRICGVNIWNWTVRAVQGCLSCAPMGHRALRLLCLNELWGTSHPSHPAILAKPWSSVALNFTSFCAFYEEIEWGEPDWGDTYPSYWRDNAHRVCQPRKGSEKVCKNNNEVQFCFI